MQELAGHGAEHYTQNACSSCSLNDMKAIKSASRRNVACFKYMAFHIISDKWYQECQDSIEDENNIVE